MGKILECIYAYICKCNYVGACSPADQIYTLTKDSSEKDKSVLAEAIRNVGRVELAKIDVKNGVCLYPNGVDSNYDLMSYTYLPTRNGGYNTFSCASLRKSLRNKSIRGSKELTHVITFDEIDEDFYVVDMVKHSYFSKHKDIALNESESIELDNEDIVCEVKPNELDELFLDSFFSRSLSASDVSRFDKKSIKTIAEFSHALLTSVKENKVLYVVYNPEEYDEFLEYLKIVLKMFPATVANQLSFVTALGKTSRINYNICGIPTSDSEYISSLRSKGNVIKITGLDGDDYLGGDKGTFASFLEKASTETLEDWLDSLDRRYYRSIHTLSDMDMVASLYTNTVGKEFDVDNPKQSLSDVSYCIEVVADNFDIISKIDGELESQIEGIDRQLTPICGAFGEYSTRDIEEYLIKPIIALYNQCISRKAKESEGVLGWLKHILIGVPRQNRALERKHYEKFFDCHNKINSLLGPNYVHFISSIEANWRDWEPFFNNYLNEPNYLEDSSEISLSFLEIFLGDLSNVKHSRVMLRNYFVSHFLQKNPEKFEKIVKIIFSHGNDGLHEKLAYILDTAIKSNLDKEDLLNNHIRFLCDYIKDNNLLDEAIKYVSDRYAKQRNEDKILDKIFKNLLGDYFVVPNKNNFNDIYNAFCKAKKLLGENPRIALSKLVFEGYAETVLKPNYKEALKKVRFENWDDAIVEKYRYFVSQLKSSSIKDSIPQEIVSAIEETLDKHDTYKAQTKREDEIIRCRIDFVVREFLLLKNKTIYNMLVKYIGADKLKSDLQVANIRGMAYKHPEFLKFAENEVRSFLCDKNEEHRKSFCDEVREERKRIVRNIGVVSKDLLGGLIGSSIFAVIMAIIAGILGAVIYTNVAGSYFKGIYDLFVGMTLVVSFILCWTNYKNRRLKNMFLISTWQSLLFILSTMGVFTLVQCLLALLVL
ncbi:MAG: Rab5-interacting family protein [Clostridia bacterium]|nr:Rab5-interacting family protein [Clostridia bacterium]